MSQTRPLWPSLVATIILAGALFVLDGPLQVASAPWGIVSFELAGDHATALKILGEWQGQAQLHAALSMGLDYAFMVAYAALLSGLAQRALSGVASAMARRAAWSAAALDAVETFALIQLLLGGMWTGWAPLAWACASLKFALIGVVIVMILAAWTRAALRRGA